jgi:hypothetical protein
MGELEPFERRHDELVAAEYLGPLPEDVREFYWGKCEVAVLTERKPLGICVPPDSSKYTIVIHDSVFSRPDAGPRVFYEELAHAFLRQPAADARCQGTFSKREEDADRLAKKWLKLWRDREEQQ